MPIFTYTPQWEALQKFYARLKPLLPPGYAGLAGIRLHRTGYPLTLELFGASPPNKPLYPLAVFRIEDGEPVPGWEKLETEFDVPWVKEADYHAYRTSVMHYYHAEDILEARAYKILNDPQTGAEDLAKAVVDHTAAAVAV